MVYAQHVEHGELGFYTVYPPGVAVILHCVPAVDGVAPELSVGGEGVGRAPGYHGWVVLTVQLELSGVCPNVRAVAGHVNWRVAYNGNALLVGIFFELAPLLEEKVLHEYMVVYLLTQLLPSLLHGGGRSEAYILLPLVPWPAVVGGLQGHKQGVILYPGGVLLPEAGQGLVLLEIAEGLAQEGLPGLSHRVVVHPGGVGAPVGFF